MLDLPGHDPINDDDLAFTLTPGTKRRGVAKAKDLPAVYQDAAYTRGSGMSKMWEMWKGRVVEPATKFTTTEEIVEAVRESTGVTIETDLVRIKPPRKKVEVATMHWQFCRAVLFVRLDRRLDRWELVSMDVGLFIATEWSITASLPADGVDLQTLPRRMVDAYRDYLAADENEPVVCYADVARGRIAECFGLDVASRPGWGRMRR